MVCENVEEYRKNPCDVVAKFKLSKIFNKDVILNVCKMHGRDIFLMGTRRFFLKYPKFLRFIITDRNLKVKRKESFKKSRR